MTTAEPSANLTILDRSECLTLLSSLTIGRLGVPRHGKAPLIVPVNYVVDREVVIFRTDPGSKLDAMRGALVSFQVDGIDPAHRVGWSVLVEGIAVECTASSTDLPLASWVSGDKRHWIRIAPETISGRRISLPEIELDARGYR